MARINLSIPDELLWAVRERCPQANVSALLQDVFRGLLDCSHKELACARCAAPVEARALVEEALRRFYSDALWRLEELVDRGGTAEGAGRVLKDVAEGHGVKAARTIPLPRPSRSRREWIRREREEASWVGR